MVGHHMNARFFDSLCFVLVALIVLGGCELGPLARKATLVLRRRLLRATELAGRRYTWCSTRDGLAPFGAHAVRNWCAHTPRTWSPASCCSSTGLDRPASCVLAINGQCQNHHAF